MIAATMCYLCLERSRAAAPVNARADRAPLRVSMYRSITRTFALLIMLGCASSSLYVDPEMESRFADVPRYSEGSGIVRPEVIHRVEPQFPRDLRREALSRTLEVTVQGVVGADGQVVAVWYGAGDRRLLSTAIEAVSQWRFRPATLNGQAIPLRFKATVGINAYIK